MIDSRLPADAIENAEANDPIDPIDNAEPIDPIDSTEPLQPMHNSESSDHNDHRDPATSVTLPERGQRATTMSSRVSALAGRRSQSP